MNKSVTELCADYPNLAEYIVQLEKRENKLLRILYMIRSGNAPLYDSDDAINFQNEVDDILDPWIRKNINKV
jgi:hypothetical protein